MDQDYGVENLTYAENAPDFLGALQLSAMRLWFSPNDDINFHSFPGRTLRSAFGRALRDVACLQPDQCQSDCTRPAECAYGLFFRPTQDNSPAAQQRDLPPGVIVRFPFTGPISFAAGEPMPLDVITIGRAMQAGQVFFEAIKLMTSHFGIGNRRITFEHCGIESICGESSALNKTLDWSDMKLDASDPRIVEVDYLSPVEIRRKGEHVFGLEFHELVWFAAQRLGMLIYTHCLDQRTNDAMEEICSWRDALAGLARGVRRLAHRFEPTEEAYSTAVFKGFTGRAIYAGRLAPFIPLLKAMEYLHLGRHAVFGCGQVAVNFNLNEH